MDLDAVQCKLECLESIYAGLDDGERVTFRQMVMSFWARIILDYES